MKSPILRNLTKLMLVNGLAVFFGLITFSSTLATAGGASTGQPPAQVGQTMVGASAIPAAANGSDVVLVDAASPEVSLPASALSITTTRSDQLIPGVFSQDWGDFDRDGYLDLALGTSQGISIYHNLRGQLVFSRSLTPGPIYGLRWADLNNDGLLELVTVGNRPGANGIYRYIGSQFISYTAFASSLPLARVTVLNDKSRDLIVSTSAISTTCPVWRYQNNGAGYFTATLRPPLCVSRAATAGIGAGDFDNDGDSDLVLGSFPNEVKLLINNGTTLTDTQNSYTFDTALSWPSDFVWGDYDSDGRLDLAAAFPLQRQVRIYHNTGSVTSPFTLSGILPTQRFMTPLSIDWGDFNGDGALDLAVADDPPRIQFNVQRSIQAKSDALILSDQATGETMWGARAVALDNSDLSLALSGKWDPTRLYGTVGGHLQSEIMPLATGGGANSIAWGDATGDGRIDLLVGASNVGTPGTLYLNSDGTLTTTGSSSFVSGRLQNVAIGKFNRDKDRQLGIVIGDTDSAGRGRINVYANWLGGNSASWLIGAPIGAVALGDFNNDGWLDLLVGTQDQNGNGTLWLYRNNRGTLVSTPIFTTSVVGQVQSIAWADYDLPTMETRYLDFAVATSNRVYVYHNNENNTFTSVPIGDAGAFNVNSTAVTWGDFDGDARPDLAVGIYGQGVRIYRYDNGSFARQWPSSDTSYITSHVTSLASGDWNNDGRIDLAVGNDGEPNLVYANLSTASDLQLTPLWASSDVGSTTAVAWGDVNNDGYLDLAVSRRNGTTGVYYNTAVSPWRLPVPPSYLSIVRPGRANTAYLYSSSDFLPGYRDVVSSELAVTATIYYTVFNPLGIPVTNTVLELSLDGGSSWQAAHYTRTLVPTQTSASGRAGVLIWDAIQDQAFSDNALLRIRIVDQAPVGPFQRAAGLSVSPPFRARAMTCQWLTGLWIDVEPGNRIDPYEVATFKAKVSDFSSGVTHYTWNFYDGTIKEDTATVDHSFKAAGTYTVSLSARNPSCADGPTLQAVKVMYVGSYTPTLSNKLYLPLVQRSSAVVQTAMQDAGLVQSRQDSVASSIGGTTACLSQTISPSSWPTVSWLTGTVGYYGQPVLNRDGSRFAFWATADLAGTNPDGSIELYYAQVDRLASCITFRQVTSSTGSILEGFNLGPTINADGDRVAFFSDHNLTDANTDHSFEIFLAQINPGGGISITQVTSSERGVSALPAINAAGDRIAFVSDRNFTGVNTDGSQEIFAATLDTSGQMLNPIQVTQANPGTFNDEPSLSSDGQRVAFVRGGSQTSGIQEIFVGNATVPNSALLTVTASPTNVLNYRPTIGGVGTQYAVAYAATDLAQEVVKVATVSGSSVNITPVYTTTRNSSAALNISDGSRVVVISDAQHISVLVPGSHSIKPIHSCAGANCPSAAISGDGMHVVFTTKQGLRESYYETATLSLLLSQPTMPVVAGTKLTRTITLVNNGPSLADGVDFSSTLRADLILPVTFTTSPTGICSGSDTVRCRLSGLAANSSAYITLTTSQEIDAGRLAPITFTVGTNAWQAYRAIINPSLNVAAEADLRVAKAVATTGVAGELVTYTLTVTNDGPSHARNLLLTDHLPDDLILRGLAAVGNQHFTLTNTAGLITGTLALLDRGTSATVQIVAELGSTALVGRLISNTGVITSSTYDRFPVSNQSVIPFVVTTRSTLTVTKAAPVTVTAGLPLTYTIIVTNTGPSAASGVVLTDSLPVSVTATFAPAGCSINGTNSQITCTLPDLQVGAGFNHTLIITAETDSEINENTNLRNTVFVNAANATRAVSNTATTLTGLGSTLRITKTATLSVTAGEPLTYTIRIENHGPSRARNLTLTDLLPTEYISYTRSSYTGGPATCSYAAGTVTCFDLDGISSYGNKTFYIYATTYQTLPVETLITNTASVTATGSWIPRESTATTRVANSISRLTAAKSAAATVMAGNSVHYTIVVTNSGPSYAPIVTVTDQLPTGVTLASSPDCAPVGGTNVECHISNLLVGATQRQTITLVGNVSYTVASGTRLTNTAEITANNAAASVNVTATTIVQTSSPLAIHKTATEFVTTVTEPTAPNEIVTYTIVVTNLGPSLARNVVLTDVLPMSVTNPTQVGVSPSITFTRDGQTLTWLLDTLAPSSTTVITLNTQVLTSTAGPVTLINTAYVTATTAPMMVTGTASTYVVPRAKLALTKTLLTPDPSSLDKVFQVVVQNLGPSIVPSATVTDDLSSFASGTATAMGEGCEVFSETFVTCTTTALTMGESRTIVITVEVGAPAFINTAYATSTIATEMVSSTAPGSAKAHLSVIKTLSPSGAVAVAGQDLTYAILVDNSGPAAHGTILTDTLPNEIITAVASPGCSGLVGHVVTCTLGTVFYTSTRSITITGRLRDDLEAGRVITNNVVVTATEATAVATDLLTTTVAVSANLQINKLAAATARAGELLTYTIIVTNAGPSIAPSVRITDMLPLPSRVTYLGQIGSEPLISNPISTGRLLTWTLSSLAPSATQIITFNVRVTNTVPGGSELITNTAYVTSTSAPAVAIGPAVTQIRNQANLILTKTLLTANPIAGEYLTYGITVTNLGPSPIPTGAAIITDQLPSELIYSSSNLALNKPATGSANGSLCSSDEDPDKAVNGSVSDKFCSSVSSSKYLQVDLGANMTVNQFIIRHANAGCDADLNNNTRDFNIQASTDGANWNTVVDIDDNSASVTTHTIAATTARYVQLNVVDGTQSATSNGTARICEFEVYNNFESNGLVTFTNDSPLGVYSSWGIAISGRIRSSATTPFINTAYATATIATAPVSHSVVTTPTVQVGLLASKSAASTVYAGNPLTYTIFITNNGPSLASIITLTDYLSPSLTIGPVPSECGAVGNVVTCTLLNMDVGPAHSRLITLIPTVNSNVLSGTQIINTAVVTGSQVLTGANATVPTTIWTAANLQMSKSAVSTVLAGNLLTYTIFITNDGPSLAPSLVVTDRLPVELGSPLMSPGCTPTAGVVTCQAFSLDQAGHRTITVTGQVTTSTPTGTVITNTAYVSSTVDATHLSHWVTTTVQTAANLAISTHIAPTSVPSTTNSAVRVTILVTNAGPSDAQSVYITETLDVLTYTTLIAKPAYLGDPTGNCGGGGLPHQCFWLISPSLPANLNGTIEFTATAPSATGTHVIEVSIASSTRDPDMSDNTSPTNLIFARALPRLYWVGLLPIRGPMALISTQPRDFWSLSP